MNIDDYWFTRCFSFREGCQIWTKWRGRSPWRRPVCSPWRAWASASLLFSSPPGRYNAFCVRFDNLPNYSTAHKSCISAKRCTIKTTAKLKCKWFSSKWIVYSRVGQTVNLSIFTDWNNNSLNEMLGMETSKFEQNKKTNAHFRHKNNLSQ